MISINSNGKRERKKESPASIHDSLAITNSILLSRTHGFIYKIEKKKRKTQREKIYSSAFYSTLARLLALYTQGRIKWVNAKEDEKEDDAKNRERERFGERKLLYLLFTENPAKCF